MVSARERTREIVKRALEHENFRTFYETVERGRIGTFEAWGFENPFEGMKDHKELLKNNFTVKAEVKKGLLGGKISITTNHAQTRDTKLVYFHKHPEGEGAFVSLVGTELAVEGKKQVERVPVEVGVYHGRDEKTAGGVPAALVRIPTAGFSVEGADPMKFDEQKFRELEQKLRDALGEKGYEVKLLLESGYGKVPMALIHRKEPHLGKDEEAVRELAEAVKTFMTEILKRAKERKKRLY